MGYESRLYIVRRNELTAPNGNKWIYADDMARFDLCVVGNNAFYDMFDKDIDYTLLDGDNEINEDMYGSHLRYTDIQTAINVLRECEAQEHYRRFPPVIAALEAFAGEEWDGELQIVHYGY